MNAADTARLFQADDDPLASVRAHRADLADLVFGSLSRTAIPGSTPRDLAFFPKETLQLDLSDPTQRAFGDYELLEQIGEGGMGVVYRARQTSLDREVALKLLSAGPWASKEYLERFRREAQNAARMQHPNIVPIYEVGEAEELHFFSMRLIRGGSLSARLKQQEPMPPRQAAALLRTIAEAVDYAHRLGVLHLDLKPANVLLDEGGAPHVADFGLARRLSNALVTENEEVSGTPSYMAPEQAVAAGRITPTTDIWGLGAMLYEFVTGMPPFLAATAQATLKLVVEGQVRNPRREAPDLPRDLEAIIMKCLARDAQARYANARALAEDLGRFLENREVRARPLNAAQRAWRWARREPKFAVAASLALLALLIGLAATMSQWRRAEANSQRAEEQKKIAVNNAAVSSQRLWESRRTAARRLQADGKAFDALPALVANIDEQEKIGRSAGIERREVGMILSQGVTLIDRMIIADASPLTTALSPDGSLLAIGLNDVSVRWYDTATLTERGRVDLVDQPTVDGSARTPVLLRFIDNHRLRVTLEWFSYMVNPADIDTILVDLDTAKAIAPPPAFIDHAGTSYSADGDYALLYGRDASAQVWQVAPWRPFSVRSKLPNLSGNVAMPAPVLLGHGGKHLVDFRSSMSGIAVSDPREPQARHEIPALARNRFTAWQESRDGARVALGDENGHVFLLDVAINTVRELPISDGSEVTWIAFSEDDAWCAVARRDGDAHAFDVISGHALHSGQLQHDFELRHVALNHREGLLVASGAGDSAIWRLPEQITGSASEGATRIGSVPTRSARAGIYWLSDSMAAGLIATADLDGEVRLWRLPVDYSHNAIATDQSQFDGKRLPDVAYNRIRVVSTDGHATPWATLPQPIYWSALTGAGKALVVTSGSGLYVFDTTANLRARYPPLSLPASPLHFAVSNDGVTAALTFGANGAAGFEERLQVFDLATGTPSSSTAVLTGPLHRLEFSSDGKKLLAVGPARGSIEAYEVAGLRRIGVYVNDAARPVLGASFTSDSRTVWMVARSVDESDAENAYLIRWDPAANAVRERRLVPGVWPVGVRHAGRRCPTHTLSA